MAKWLKSHLPLKVYMRDGYRWYELKIGRRRWLTWQMPFTRYYSIAWSQGVIDRDREEEIAIQVAEFRAGLITDVDLRIARNMSNKGEFFDSG